MRVGRGLKDRVGAPSTGEFAVHKKYAEAVATPFHRPVTVCVMDFNYPHVGITRRLEPRPGYRILRYTTRLSIGFDMAADNVMTWRMHRNVGLRPVTGASRATVGAEMVSRIGPLKAPCRVVWVVEEPNRVGFGYGTLPGHPVAGEEAFTVERDAAGAAWFTVVAISRANSRLTRWAGPLVPMAQWLFARWFAHGANRRPSQAALGWIALCLPLCLPKNVRVPTA